ncbi:1,5-anhydro-D-fructose reductase [Novipirellula galeiformis]|uniref:1,5-anhydro-D-fructose reductase n=1 Tax=Novipirellula galeiformis TaxID=2528004 RepID=A0A5C6CLS7_9BACT|nr:Gfo/Idh/MocA family oxidoreductase [Novipirellula galeiformis]TWU24271.1 1,5-anhydro-D-fructose reductase [Novipirellula galeiformis]
MNTIRWGLIGCGDVSRKRVAQAIQNTPGNELIAACRRDSDRLDEFCDALSIPRRYTDASALMKDIDVDAVYIATPVREHLPQARMAAAAGKHVLVEKPMAMDVAECGEMIEVCATANVRLGVAYYRRFYPLLQRIEDLLKSNAIGTPLAVSAVTATPVAMQPGEEGHWRTERADSGGGALMDVGSHRINVFLHLFGPIAEVKSICTTVAADYEVEDTAALLLRFECGMVGTLQCHFGADDPDEFAITGTRGRLRACPLNGDQLIIERDGEQTIETLPPAANFCQPLIADFADAIRNNRSPRVNGDEGRRTNIVMANAYDDSQ